MSSNVYEVEQALLSLSQKERAAVIQRGIDSLEPPEHVAIPDSDNESAWTAEALRRLKEVKDNKVNLLDLEESHRQLRAVLAIRH